MYRERERERERDGAVVIINWWRGQGWLCEDGRQGEEEVDRRGRWRGEEKEQHIATLFPTFQQEFLMP